MLPCNAEEEDPLEVLGLEACLARNAGFFFVGCLQAGPILGGGVGSHAGLGGWAAQPSLRVLYKEGVWGCGGGVPSPERGERPLLEPPPLLDQGPEPRGPEHTIARGVTDPTPHPGFCFRSE